MPINKMQQLPGGLNLMPCGPNVCQMCAVDHQPMDPHNAQSLYYQYRFYGLYGRFPTWADALAHCSNETVTIWICQLNERSKGAVCVSHKQVEAARKFMAEANKLSPQKSHE